MTLLKIIHAYTVDLVLIKPNYSLRIRFLDNKCLIKYYSMARLKHKLILELRVMGLKSFIYFEFPFLGIMTTKLSF